MASKMALLVLGLATTSAQLLGSWRCSDPDFWCTDLDSASRCDATSYCRDVWSQPVGRLNDQLCDICIQGMDMVIGNLESHEDEAKAAVEQLCNYCSTPDRCRQSIEAHWDDVIAFVEAGLDAKMICSSINMCQQVSEINNSEMLVLAGGFTGPLLTPQDMLPNPPKDTKVRFVPIAHSAKIEVHRGEDHQECSKLCQDCVNFAQDLKVAMHNPARLEKLTKTIQLLCEQLPMRGLCRLVLNKKVVLGIIDKVSPVEVCRKSEVCMDTDDPEVPRAADGMCNDCHHIITDFEAIADKDMDGLQKIIYNSCELMPNKVFIDMCQTMSAQLAEQAKNSLHNADVDQACSDLALCGPPPTPSSINTELSSKTCDYCIMAVEYLELAVDSDMTSDELKAGLKELCEKTMPPGLDSVCKNFVDEHWDDIVNDLDKFLDDPEGLCRHLHLCPRAAWYNLDETTRTHLESVHELLPSECTFGPQVWCKSKEMEQLCKAEDYCKNHKPKPLLGARSCTYGPTFWCSNHENAELCDAKNYCSKMKLGAFSGED